MRSCPSGGRRRSRRTIRTPRCPTGRSRGRGGSPSGDTCESTRRPWPADGCSTSASGSGLCAIAALQAGASTATGADIDGFAAAAIDLNARANGCRVAVIRRDVLDDEPPDVDVILAGDCLYDAQLARRVVDWLRRARERGIEVLLGDPGRRYLPTDGLIELASYEVRTTTELEDLERKQGWVYAMSVGRASLEDREAAGRAAR